jgi:hypothetical protein
MTEATLTFFEEGVEVPAITKPLATPSGLALSNCFSATASSAVAMGFACEGQTVWKIQYASRVFAFTVGFASAKPFLIMDPMDSTPP